MSAILTELRMTCFACPAQWEGRTADGRHVCVRYRYGALSVGFGADLNAAVEDSRNNRQQLGDGLDGYLTGEEMFAATGLQMADTAR